MLYRKRTGSFLGIMMLFALSGCGISKPDSVNGTDIVERTACGGEEQLPDSADNAECTSCGGEERISDSADNAECTARGGEEQLPDSADYAEDIPSDESGQDEAAPSAEILWEEAASLIAERNYPQAIFTLSKIEEDERAEKILQQLRYLISGEYIVNLDFGVAAINREGKVVICADADNYEEIGYTEVQSWTDIVKLSRAFLSLDALSRDGHFFTTLQGEEYKKRNERLAQIPDIDIFETSSGSYAVTDRGGELYCYSAHNDYLELESVRSEMESWSEIVDTVTGDSRIAVLHRDGTVSFVYCNKLPGQTIITNSGAYMYDDTAEWTDIVDICGDSAGNIAGLRADGTVLVSERGIRGDKFGTDYHQAAKWTDIIAISKSYFTLLGLKRDGTVVIAGAVGKGQEEVTEWTDIVAIAAGDDVQIGLKSDGTLVLAGEKEEWWEDAAAIKDLYVPTIELGE